MTCIERLSKMETSSPLLALSQGNFTKKIPLETNEYVSYESIRLTITHRQVNQSFPPVQKNTHYMMIFDGFVILTCLASLILCTRSVIKGIHLQRVSLCLSVSLNKCNCSFSTAISLFLPTHIS